MRHSTHRVFSSPARRTRVRCAGGRYRADGSAEARYEPGSNRRVLRNLPGIRSVREMDRVERRCLYRATEWALGHFDAGHCFSAADVRRLHRQWLGGIYSWAGDYRRVNVSKAGFMFAAAAQVPRLMSEFESDCLARNSPPAGSEKERLFAIAEVHTELLLIHPFREGNGRLARLLATLMLLQAGFPKPSFELLLKKHRAAYFAAVRAGLDRNYAPMQRLFSSIVNGDSACA